MSRLAPWLRLALALALLNALLTLGAPAASFWPQLGARVSLELCAGVAGLAGWIAWRGGPAARATRWLAAASAALIAVHLLDLAATALFGRPLNLYWDGRHLGSVLAQHEVPGWQVAAVGGVLLLAVAAVAWLAWACWRAVAHGLAARPARPSRTPGKSTAAAHRSCTSSCPDPALHTSRRRGAASLRRPNRRCRCNALARPCR